MPGPAKPTLQFAFVIHRDPSEDRREIPTQLEIIRWQDHEGPLPATYVFDIVAGFVGGEGTFEFDCEMYRPDGSLIDAVSDPKQVTLGRVPFYSNIWHATLEVRELGRYDVLILVDEEEVLRFPFFFRQPRSGPPSR